MIDEINSFKDSVLSGEYFINNYEALMTNVGINQLIKTALLTGLCFMVVRLFTSKKKKKGIMYALVLFIGGTICTGLAHALFQIFTGIPLNFF